MEQKEIELLKDDVFNQINECLAELDAKTGSDITSTNHIFDVLEEVVARVVAGSSSSEENLAEIAAAVSERVLSMAEVFFKEEEEAHDSPE